MITPREEELTKALEEVKDILAHTNGGDKTALLVAVSCILSYIDKIIPPSAAVAAEATPTQVDPMVTLLQEAMATVTGPRRKDYGNPEDDLQCTGDLWSTWLNRRFGTSINMTGSDVSLLMVLLKATRLAHSPGHRDSFTDMVGYSATGWRCHVVARGSP